MWLLCFYGRGPQSEPDENQRTFGIQPETLLSSMRYPLTHDFNLWYCSSVIVGGLVFYYPTGVDSTLVLWQRGLRSFPCEREW